jgi:hypothetical protein
MNHRIKKTALILAFFVFFINYQGFAGSKQEIDKVKEDIKRIDGDLTNINEKLSLLNDKIPDPGKVTPEHNPENAPSDTAAIGKIPVTSGIVDYFLNSNGKYEGLKFYLSKPFALKIQNDIAEIDVKDNMVMLNSPNPDKEIKFTEDSEGILNEISMSDKGSEIKILFKEEGKTLVFIRKPNGYELSSIVINDRRTQKIQLSEPIKLLVSGKNNRKAEVNVASAYYADPPEYQPYEPPHYKIIPAKKYTDDYEEPAIYSRYIMGCGSINKKGVIAYVKKTRHLDLSMKDIAIINEYFHEAEYEGVNVDIAIAQMLYLTNFFRSQNIMSTYNFAGLRDLPPNFFRNMEIGVQAHIQHLKAYAKEPLKRRKVDPRYDLAYDRGSRGIKFEQIYRHWSENREYGRRIDDILCELYEYSCAR